MIHVKQKCGARSHTFARIAFLAVVEEAELRQFGDEVHEVEAARFVALADFGFGDVVPAGGDSCTHTGDV